MKKSVEPFVLGNAWYSQPTTCVARVTTAQWRQMLLEENDTFIALGHVWQLTATRVGPGVYEIKAKQKYE